MRDKPNLDLLRSFAIFVVVLDHILLAQGITQVSGWQPAWIGVVGVYFFFVHTALVLMWSLERKPHTLDFYIRRAFRIFPLVWVALAAYILTLALVGRTTTNFFSFIPPDASTLVANSLLIQNLILRQDIIGVLWSLPLEVDMYVLLPVLFFFVRKNFSLWPLLVIWVLTVGLARHHIFEGNQFDTVIACFLPGVMAYVLYRRVRPRIPAWLLPVFLLTLCSAFMAHPAVGRSWPMCLALGLGLPFFRQISFAPLVKLSHEIAKYSYGIYLSHVFAISLGFRLLRGHALWIELGVTLLATAIFSFSAYHLVEKPLIGVGARLAAKAERQYEQKHLDAYL